MGLWGRVSARAIDAVGHDIIRGLKWQYFLNIGIGIFGAAYIVFAGRLLGAVDFGVYAICLAIPTFVGAIFDCRLQEVAIYLAANLKGDAFKTAAGSLVLTDFLMKLAAGASSLLVAYICMLLNYGALSWQMVASATAMVFATKVFNAPSMGFLRLSGHLQVFSVLQVADWAARLAVLGALAMFDRASINNLFLSQLMVGAIFNSIVIRRAFSTLELSLVAILKRGGDLRNFLSDHARVVFGSQSVSAMDSVVKELDVLVCGIFLAPAQVGIYKMTKSLAGVAWRLADPVYIVVLPKLANLHSEGQTAQLASVTRQLTFGLAVGGGLLLAASTIGVWLFAPWFLGPEYFESIRLFPLAAIWIAIALPLIWTHSLAIGAGRPDIQFKAGLVGNGVGLMAIVVGSAWLALPGALAGLSLAYCLPFVVSFFILRRNRVVRW